MTHHWNLLRDRHRELRLSSASSKSGSQKSFVPGVVMEDPEDRDTSGERSDDDQPVRMYSNLLDLPGVSLNPDVPGGVNINPRSLPGGASSWVNHDTTNPQDRRFYNDFRPFFLLCQLSGMFPQVLHWKMGFSWFAWGTVWSLFLLFILCFLLLFYIIQVVLTVRSGLIYISYNLAWLVHVSHSVDWILLFILNQKMFTQIWQGYRKFYRYLLADGSDRSVIRFTWKTFVGWEIMFYITATALILKSYSDRFIVPDFAAKEGEEVRNISRKTILATVDQLAIVQSCVEETGRNILFWIHLTCNVICLNIVFLSEVFFMVMISIIFHAFAFIHKRIDCLLGNPDTIFNVQAVHDPMKDFQVEVVEQLVESRTDGKLRPISAISENNYHRSRTAKSLHSSRVGGRCEDPNIGISIRALWEQMEELIDLLDQVNAVFGMTLQFLALEYLIFFPALLYFCIELYPTLGVFSLSGFLVSGIILGIRSLVFTSVCARVHREATSPIKTLYRAYVKGDVSWQEQDLVNMFITRLSSTTIAVRTWSHVPITRQTFTVIFFTVFAILALLLQSDHMNTL